MLNNWSWLRRPLLSHVLLCKMLQFVDYCSHMLPLSLTMRSLKILSLEQFVDYCSHMLPLSLTMRSLKILSLEQFVDYCSHMLSLSLNMRSLTILSLGTLRLLCFRTLGAHRDSAALCRETSVLRTEASQDGLRVHRVQCGSLH